MIFCNTSPERISKRCYSKIFPRNFQLLKSFLVVVLFIFHLNTTPALPSKLSVVCFLSCQLIIGANLLCGSLGRTKVGTTPACHSLTCCCGDFTKRQPDRIVIRQVFMFYYSSSFLQLKEMQRKDVANK